MTSAINQADIEYLRAITAPQTASDYCLAAAAYIREHGWTQRVFEDTEGRVCAMGAHIRVGFRPDTNQVAHDKALLELCNVVGKIGPWNDAPKRTEADVIGAWMLAAMNLKRRGE